MMTYIYNSRSETLPWESKGLAPLSLVGMGVSRYDIELQDKIQLCAQESGLFTTGLYDSASELEENLDLLPREIGSVLVLDSVARQPGDFTCPVTTEIPDLLKSYGHFPRLLLVRYSEVSTAERELFLGSGYEDVLGYDSNQTNGQPFTVIASAMKLLGSRLKKAA